MEASFRTINFPNLFIRHRHFLGEISSIESDLDKHDATFIIERRQADERIILFRSINIAGHLLRHQDFRIKLHPEPGLFDPSQPLPPLDPIHADSQFIMEPGLADASAFSFRSVNFPDFFLRHRDFQLFIDHVNSPNLRLDATFRQEPPFIVVGPPPPIH